MNSDHNRFKPVAQPGLVLREVRKRSNWTLADVSKRTGLPTSTLSKIENGKVSLSYDKLLRLSTGLEIDIAQMLDSSNSPNVLATVSGRRSITRAGDGLAIETATYSHLYPASDLLSKRFVPIVAELHAHSLKEFGEMVRHPGEEFTYILEGTAELHTETYAPVLLNTGDSIYFDSGMAHAYIAVGASRCRVLSICSATQAQLLEATGVREHVSHDAPMRTDLHRKTRRRTKPEK